MAKVLVTGHRGYIGPHLIDLLKQSGHQVTGVDLRLFTDCEWEMAPVADIEMIKDFRQLTHKDLLGLDCIIHLAAISNDPMGDLAPSLTYAINREGSIAFAEKAKAAGVPKFLFSSSCSIYGKSASQALDETQETSPLTAYASSKIAVERRLQELADDSFSPVSLRNATAYGHSPMLRIDLVVNNLLACGLTKGEILVTSDGSPWRPLIHCKDIARTFLAIMEAPRDRVHNQIINVGANRENYQVKEILSRVQHFLPTAQVSYTGEVGADPRNYSVNFDKLASLLPDFQLSYNLEKGMEELFKKYSEHRFSRNDFEGDRFVRLRALKKALHQLRG